MRWDQTAVVAVVCAGLMGLALGLILQPVTVEAGEHKLALWLDVVHRVCTAIGGLGTLGALVFVAQQFQLLRMNVKASMDNTLYMRLDSFNRFIVEHHKIYEQLKTPYNLQQDQESRARLHHLCELGFTFYEEIYKHHTRHGLLDTEDWDEWRHNMAHFFSKPYVRGYWRQVAPRYATTFQRFGNDLCAITPELNHDAG